jgi:hypothetical protein
MRKADMGGRRVARVEAKQKEPSAVALQTAIAEAPDVPINLRGLGTVAAIG